MGSAIERNILLLLSLSSPVSVGLCQYTALWLVLTTVPAVANATCEVSEYLEAAQEYLVENTEEANCALLGAMLINSYLLQS